MSCTSRRMECMRRAATLPPEGGRGERDRRVLAGRAQALVTAGEKMKTPWVDPRALRKDLGEVALLHEVLCVTDLIERPFGLALQRINEVGKRPERGDPHVTTSLCKNAESTSGESPFIPCIRVLRPVQTHVVECRDIHRYLDAYVGFAQVGLE